MGHKPHQGPFQWHGLTLIPVWISGHTSNKVCGEFIYPFQNFNAEAGMDK